jgi:hypothetical protein
MRALRENVVPVAFLTLWVAVSGYTLHSLERLRAPRVIEATMHLTVTPALRSTPRASCSEKPVLPSLDIYPG